MIKLNKTIEAIRSGLHWDFYEDSQTVREDACETSPGLLVSALRSEGCGDRVIGLLSAISAIRSLPCWFFYCSNRLPLDTCLLALDFWNVTELSPQILPSDLFIPVEPCDADGPIIDCRYTDTFSASSAASLSAQFTQTIDDLDAITALSHAHTAFDSSPIGGDESIGEFVRWVIDTAVPMAVHDKVIPWRELLHFDSFELPESLATVVSKNSNDPRGG